jgi:PhoH-like ATPase
MEPAVMIKTFVLDTNVLLHDPTSLVSLEDNHVVIPMPVIEELDKFKSRHDELGRNSREVIRRIDELRERGSLREGVSLDNAAKGKAAGTLRILTGSRTTDSTLDGLDLELPDNRILRLAYDLHRQGETVIFVSKDINIRVKGDALGLQVMDYEKDQVNFDELYTGYRELKVPGAVIDSFYRNTTLPLEGAKLYPNEFVLLIDEDSPKHTALARADGQSSLKHLCNHFEKAWNIAPRSKEQRMAMDLLLDPTVELVTLVGKAGTGKTLIAIAAGLEAVLHMKRYEKILVSRPIVPLGKDLGYLPGDKDEKLGHWMQPIFDNLDYLMHAKKKGSQSARQEVDELMKEDKIELEALTYIRGRSIPRQYLIVDEAQNLTPHEIKTIISRAGEATKVVLTGDPYQIDNPYLDSASNGLIYAVERLKKLPLHGHVTLRKSERSPLAAAAAEYL